MMGAWLRKWIWETGAWALLLLIILLIGILLLCRPVYPPPSRAKVNATKIEINGNLMTALGQFEVNVGRFPTTAEGLKALVECPPTIPKEKWQDPYMDSFPQDAWRHEFRYICPSPNKNKAYDVISAGPDGIFGTRDDITNDLPAKHP